jgi:serine/threonine protein kinase
MHDFVWQVVKVCDFGVARLKPIPMSSSGKGGWTTEMTAETGTYRWMAPEVSIQQHSFTPRSNNSMVKSVLHGKDVSCDASHGVLSHLQ